MKKEIFAMDEEERKNMNMKLIVEMNTPLKDKTGTHIIKVILDTAAESSIITKKLVDELNLNIMESNFIKIIPLGRGNVKQYGSTNIILNNIDYTCIVVDHISKDADMLLCFP